MVSKGIVRVGAFSSLCRTCQPIQIADNGCFMLKLYTFVGVHLGCDRQTKYLLNGLSLSKSNWFLGGNCKGEVLSGC